MKKILAVTFALLLIATNGLVAFAANGSFVNSPSGQMAPVLVDVKNESEECEAVATITAYADREKLDDEARNALVDAYEAIAATADLGTLSNDVAKLAKKLGVSSDELVVSDLFDISYSDCVTHEEHLGFSITIKPTSVENFAGILHYDGEQWEVIEGNVVNDEIVFFAKTLSPFAVMVQSEASVEQPSEPTNTWVFAILLLLLLVLVIVLIIWLTSKKKKAQNQPEQ